MPRRPVILEGERVFLSPPTKEDVELLLEYINDKEVTQYLNLFPRIMTREMEERWLDNILNGREKDLFFFSIILKENGSLIGNSSLKVYFFNRTGRLGISLWRKDLWGRELGERVCNIDSRLWIQCPLLRCDKFRRYGVQRESNKLLQVCRIQGSGQEEV